MSDIYMVVDEKNNVAAIQTKLFGRQVRLAAIFHDEEDALEFLWSCQEQISRPHKVIKSSSLMMSL